MTTKPLSKIINRDASLFDYWRIGYKSEGKELICADAGDKEVSIGRLRARLETIKRSATARPRNQKT